MCVRTRVCVRNLIIFPATYYYVLASTITMALTTGQWIAIAIVAIIVLVLVFGASWKTRPGVSYVVGVTPTTSGNFRNLGGAKDPAACQALCADKPWCNAYTWTQTEVGDNTCTGVADASSAISTLGGNYTSGNKLTTYSAKLMHNFGMESAGNGDSSLASETYSVRAPSTAKVELFGNVRAPSTTPVELMTVRAPRATPVELMTVRAPRATPVELMTVRAPSTAPVELFRVGQPGAGTVWANYM